MMYKTFGIVRNTIRRVENKQKFTGHTRLHSSRIHTARLLTVSPSMHCTGGCLLRGHVWSGVGGVGCLLQGVVCSGVCAWFRRRGVPGPWGGGGVVVSQHTLRQIHAPPWTEWQTGAKILPCPKLRLRAVNITDEAVCPWNIPVNYHSVWLHLDV